MAWNEGSRKNGTDCLGRPIANTLWTVALTRSLVIFDKMRPRLTTREFFRGTTSNHVPSFFST